MTGYRERQERIRRGELRCVPPPWFELNRLRSALRPGHVTILAGTKGAAKSFLLLECVRSWLEAGENVATYIMEGSREEYLDCALAQIAGKPDVTNIEWQREHADEMRALTDEHVEALVRLAAVVTHSATGATLEDVADWIDGEAPRNRILCIDPITMAMRTRKPWVSDKVFLDHAKHAAESRGCSIVLVSHLQKGGPPVTMTGLGQHRPTKGFPTASFSCTVTTCGNPSWAPPWAGWKSSITRPWLSKKPERRDGLPAGVYLRDGQAPGGHQRGDDVSRTWNYRDKNDIRTVIMNRAEELHMAMLSYELRYPASTCRRDPEGRDGVSVGP